MITNVGIIGAGFVGGACYKAFEQLNKVQYRVRLYDINPTLSLDNFIETAGGDFVFVCVPTPTDFEAGICDTSIVESVIKDVRAIRKDNLIVVKSTIPPGSTERFAKIYGNVCFNPEFLREVSPYEDFVSLPYQIIGTSTYTDSGMINNLCAFFRTLGKEGITKKPDVIYTCPARLAELSKYARNAYLAMRLSYFNELNQICEATDIQYDDLKHLIGLDERIGSHYNKVERGNEGWGGKCLVKDLAVLIGYEKLLDVFPTITQAVWDKNIEVRKTQDWLEIPGVVAKK